MGSLGGTYAGIYKGGLGGPFRDLLGLSPWLIWKFY